MIVVDSNVLSELMRERASPVVFAWAGKQVPGAIHTTAISVAEVRFGIERLPEGARKQRLRSIESDVFEAFVDHVLPFDEPAALEYALVAASRERDGNPAGSFDTQIAAICRAHGATLATRNTKHFTGLGIDLVDPWHVGT